ncbi:uncharacterized protein LOC124898919 [Capsicum annuum]|uniref:uncharacterized protein LOC124898919 n=1 Tax=Capsicum annuum TaxID=4072 RepID=UPI001FB173BD|nr:uncharacterized protein LOC124898919 [Capsicum annuum]
MTVKEYCHKFNQLSKYAPGMMADSRTSMSKLLAGVSGHVVKECRSAMLNRDMDLSRLMIHAQQIEADKVKGRVRVRGNKRVRSEQQGYSQARFSGGIRPQFQSCSLVPALSSASTPASELGRSRVIGLLCAGPRIV